MRPFLPALLIATIISVPTLASASSTPDTASNGLVTIKSHHDVKVTTDRLVNALDKKGMTVFARINHAEGAAKVGEELRPTELVIFGTPKVGSPLMQCEQSVGIDLPLKALVWEDEKGGVWFSYNDPAYIAGRHNIKACGKIISKMTKALSNFSKVATKP